MSKWCMTQLWPTQSILNDFSSRQLIILFVFAVVLLNAWKLEALCSCQPYRLSISMVPNWTNWSSVSWNQSIWQKILENKRVSLHIAPTTGTNQVHDLESNCTIHCFGWMVKILNSILWVWKFNPTHSIIVRLGMLPTNIKKKNW